MFLPRPLFSAISAVFESFKIWLHELLINVSQSFGCLLTSDKSSRLFGILLKDSFALDAFCNFSLSQMAYLSVNTNQNIIVNWIFLC